ENAAPPLNEVRDKRVTDLVAPRAASLTVILPSADPITLNRDGVIWKFAPADDEGAAAKTADRTAVNDLLKAVQNLKAVGFESAAQPEFGLDAPRIQLQIEVDGRPEPIEIAVGSHTPSQTGVYIRNTREDFIAVI